MWNDVISATNFSFAWLILVSTLFLLLRIRPIPDLFTYQFLKSQHKSWIAVLLLALIVRIVPLILLPVGAGYDIASFQLVGDALVNGQEVYTSAAVGRHPYLPFQMYWVGLAYYLSQATSVPFVIVIKTLPVAIDIAIVAFIYFIGRKNKYPQDKIVFLSLLYALNPIALLVSSYHGQFDSIPVLLMMISWYFYHFRKHLALSATALGFAILNKSWPIVMLPLVLIRLRSPKQWFLYTAVALGIPFFFTTAYVLLFNSDPNPMLRRALTHTGPSGYWGYSAVLGVASKYSISFQNIFDTINNYRRWFLLVGGLIALLRTRNETLMNALVTTILTVLAFSVGMGIQWLLWVVPFAILSLDIKWLKVYSIAGTVFVAGQLFGLHMYPWAYELFKPETADNFIRLLSIPAWAVTTLWAGYRLKLLPPYNKQTPRKSDQTQIAATTPRDSQ